jgi:flagellar basal-body rod modification protein FlgD
LGITTTNNINSYNTSSTSSASSNTTKNNAASMDTFLQLLSKEMQNQDVLNPSSNTEYITQLSQFTSLQALQNLVNYANNQNDLQTSLLGSSIVGKSVIVASYDSETNTLTKDHGIVTKCDFSQTTPMVTVNGKEYSLGSVMEVDNSPTADNFQYGTSLVGKTVTVTGTDAKGNSVDTTGVVSGCIYKNGNVSLVIDGKEYSLSAVTKVVNGTEASDTSQSSGKDSNSEASGSGSTAKV